MSLQQALIQALATAATEVDKPHQTNLADDLVHGASGIAKFLFGSDAPPYRRKVYLLSDRKRRDRLPVFRMGNKIFARKSTLLKVIEQRELQM